MNKSSEWSYITSVYIRVLRGSTQCLFFSSFFFIRFFFVSLESDQHANSSSYREKKRIRWTTVFPVNESKKQTNRNQTKNENTEHYLSEKERTSRYTCWHCRMHINRFSNIFFSLFFHLQMYICFSFFFFRYFNLATWAVRYHFSLYRMCLRPFPMSEALPIEPYIDCCLLSLHSFFQFPFLIKGFSAQINGKTSRTGVTK